MSNDPVDGGTVTQQIEGHIVAVDFDRQTITLSFAEDARVPLKGDATVTFATPPEPAPLVVTCNGHSIELAEGAARMFVRFVNDTPQLQSTSHTLLAELLDAATDDPWPDAYKPLGSYRTFNPDAFVDTEPEADDTASDIDFDALPDGTVLLRTDGRPGVRIKVDGVWTFDGHGIAAPLLRKNWKVHQPAPLSPGECLRGLLAGRDDADELIEWAAQNERHWPSQEHLPNVRLTEVIRDAARAVHG